MSSCKHCNSQNVKLITSYRFHNIIVCNDCKLWTYKQIDDCCRTPNKVLVFQYVNGQATFIREQCLNCGGCLNMSKPLAFKQYSNKVHEKYSFSRERLDEYKSERQLERTLIYETEKVLKRNKSTYYKYLIHLQSDYWKNIRRKALERDEEICQKCKQARATEVHHLTYENLGNEQLEDLLSLCSVCHKIVHGTPLRTE